MSDIEKNSENYWASTARLFAKDAQKTDGKYGVDTLFGRPAIAKKTVATFITTVLFKF